MGPPHASPGFPGVAPRHVGKLKQRAPEITKKVERMLWGPLGNHPLQTHHLYLQLPVSVLPREQAFSSPAPIKDPVGHQESGGQVLLDPALHKHQSPHQLTRGPLPGKHSNISEQAQVPLRPTRPYTTCPVPSLPTHSPPPLPFAHSTPPT